VRELKGLNSIEDIVYFGAENEMSVNKCSYDNSLGPQPTRRTSWKLVANLGWQPGFPTSFQLVRLVGCDL